MAPLLPDRHPQHDLFICDVADAVLKDVMPIYRVELEGDSIVFGNRETMNEARATHDWPALDPETYHEARIAAPSYDVHFLERDWMEFWVDSAKLELRNPDKAFVAFCRRRHERSPDP